MRAIVVDVGPWTGCHGQGVYSRIYHWKMIERGMRDLVPRAVGLEKRCHLDAWALVHNVHHQDEKNVLGWRFRTWRASWSSLDGVLASF